jgi:hypothetical protein
VRVHRSDADEDTIAIPTSTLQDERLSFAARGLLAELLTLPDGSQLNGDEISRRAREHRPGKQGEGRRAIHALLRELEEHGYLVRGRAKASDGLFVSGAVVYDRPQPVLYQVESG